MTDEQEDPRDHIDDWEWLYQHGYLDNTLYAASRRLEEAFMRLMEALGIVWLARNLDAGLEWLTRRIGRHA